MGALIPNQLVAADRALPSLPASAPLSVALDILRAQGVLVIPAALSADQLARMDAELAPWFDAACHGAGQFFGKGTRRFSGVFAKAPSTAQLAEHPLILALAEGALKGAGETPICDAIDLNLTQAIGIEPGEPPQFLHRDEELWPFARHFEVMVNVMWTFDDFTVENGATRLVPGSHAWPREREPQPGDAIQAIAPRGSAIVWLGGVLHGGGANLSGAVRKGIILSYKLAWLAPAEKLLLSISPEVARQLSPTVQRLIGYQIHRPNLGWIEGQDPIRWLNGEVQGLASAEDNLTPFHNQLLEDVALNPEKYLAYIS